MAPPMPTTHSFLFLALWRGTLKIAGVAFALGYVYPHLATAMRSLITHSQ